MGLITANRDRFRREDVTLQLDDIQALILRNRPEPHVGIHAMLHIDDAEGGRDLIARLAPHIPSAEGFHDDLDAWTGVAFSHEGLKALGVPEATLKTFRWRFNRAWRPVPTSCATSARTRRKTGTRRFRASNATSR